MNDNQRYRTVISSTHLDRHGDIISREALEQMASTINDQSKRVRMGVDHRREFPPLGRLENAEIVKKGDHYFLEADYCKYKNLTVVDWNSFLLMEYFDDEFQFVEVSNEPSQSTIIFIDRQNFKSKKEIDDLVKAIKNEHDVDIQYHGRKALIPDPEIIFQLTATGIFYHLIKPTIKKLGEKVADHFVDKVYNLIKKTTSKIFSHTIPKSKPVVVVFDIPGIPHIELIAKTRDQELLLKSLSEKKISLVREKIEELSKNVKIAKIQFLLDKKGNWKFNYLITKNGSSIGTKESFKKRNKKFELITKRKK